MYSWHTLRRFLLVLLLLPAAHVSYLLVKDYRSITNPDPTVWEDEVLAIERRVSLDPPGPGPLLVVGGRKAKLWRDLDSVLWPLPVVNAGIGSANLEDVLYYFERLATASRPRAVLLVLGPTDFVLRDSKSAADFVLMARGLASYTHRLDPPPHLYLLTLNQWPRYPELWPTVATVNNEFAAWAEADTTVTLIDDRKLLTAEPERGGYSNFRNDRINLNDWGYGQLSLLLRQQMERDYPALFSEDSPARE